MDGPAGLPVVDHHCHLSPVAEGVQAALRFARNGGTHLFLTTMNWTGKNPVTLDDYQVQYEGMESLGRRIRDESGVTPYLVVAPYPVDLVGTADALGLEAAVELQKAALDLAADWIRAGRAVALGEVGRPHFPISTELAHASSVVFRHALELARDLGCPAVVHCEDLDAEGFRQLGALARSVGLRTNRVVKHYAREVVPDATRGPVVPSYLARDETTRQALTEPAPWFLETDFLDDPRRPGAVLDLGTIPRRVKTIAATTPELIERFHIPFEESVRQVYGFTPVLRGGP